MYASMEGCIGTGKTTLARLLSMRYAGTPLLEETSRHPFIAEFYLDPERNAFQTEMNFILIHYHQLRRAQQDGVFDQLVFADFIFDKDRLFADLTLTDPDEQRLFTLTYDFLRQRIPTPDVLICLKSPTEFLWERIRKRARDLEAPMTYDYLDQVNSKYNEFFEAYDQSEKIILNAPELNITEGSPSFESALLDKVIPALSPILGVPPRA
ncbi:deoxynucleoside kinase [Anaerobaca lacustris]|uniref:Deoxynucleoside kinase n=1 Tax=Anaerobaca lacustris TaxID=3044600 RepID=A0AAW6TT08_9BACT|nr:deoxynucleoside kinase [Sedimentisphaerales bacterium M17dextr]